jgi:hypothetical protein
MSPYDISVHCNDCGKLRAVLLRIDLDGVIDIGRSKSQGVHYFIKEVLIFSPGFVPGEIEAFKCVRRLFCRDHRDHYQCGQR